MKMRKIAAYLAFATALGMTAGVVVKAPTSAAKGPSGDMMGDQHERGVGVERQAMMAKIQEMKVRLQAMDATFDKLVAEMNAAETTQQAGAMEWPMVAVVNELVFQRMEMRSMVMEMQAVMMAQGMRQAHLCDATGAMPIMSDCPLMTMGGQQGRIPQLTREKE